MHDGRALATGGAKPGGIGAVSEHDQNSIAAENAAILHTTGAFSNEVDTGTREENASKQKSELRC
jgi:hypothetical protein